MKAPRITKEELKRRLDDNSVVVLDVRNAADFASSDVRIPGAVRLTLEELEARAYELDFSKEVVAYCT